MIYFGDTNVVYRFVAEDDPLHHLCLEAIIKLNARGDEVVITPRVLIEFWALATRSLEANGLALTTSEAVRVVTILTNQFRVLR